jgi:GMP synthase-like glutamine amidotransferase
MSEQRKIIGVLETGRPPESLSEDYPDYPTMVADWLSPVDADFKFFAALDGELPASPAECDLWVITGSRFGVYEGHPWIPQLEDFVRACHSASRPMVGICFGHQLIAQALGGVVGKSDKGWGLGVTSYPAQNWPKELGHTEPSLDIQAYHQDQVETAPPGAQVISSTDFCPISALWYPGFAITVQGHPEFKSDYFQALMGVRRGGTVTDQQADAALETQTRPINPEWLAETVRKVFLSNNQE